MKHVDPFVAMMFEHLSNTDIFQNVATDPVGILDFAELTKSATSSQQIGVL